MGTGAQIEREGFRVPPKNKRSVSKPNLVCPESGYADDYAWVVYMRVNPMNRTSLLLAGVAPALCSILVILFSARAEPGPGPLRVGVILPLTGKGSSAGIAIRNGVQMALDKLSASERRQFAVSFEDDGSESMKTVSAFKQLLITGPLDVVVTAFGNAGHAVAPLSESAGIIHVGITVDSSIVHGRTKTYALWVSQDELAKAAVGESLRLGYRRMAVAISQHEGNIAMRKAFLEAAGGRIQFPISLEAPLDDLDLNTLALKIKAAGQLDCIANLMHPVQVGRLVMALRRIGVRTPHVALGHFEDLGIRRTVGHELIGSWYPAARYSAGFVSEYQSRFPSDSVYGAAYGHDVIVMLSTANRLELRGEALGSFLNDLPALEGTAVAGLSSDGRHGFRMPVEMRVVGEDGIGGITDT